jgi:CheY-like chemotaxis protein
VTASSLPEDRSRALGAGFDIFLSKPIEPAGLIVTIESLAKQPRSRHADEMIV